MESQGSTVTVKELPNGDIQQTHTASISIRDLITAANQTPLGVVAFQVADDTGWEICPAPIARDWMEEHSGHAYRCLPLTIANTAGWIIKNPVTFTAVWNGGPSKKDITIYSEDPLSKFKTAIVSHFGNGVLTFQIPWLFQTEDETVSLTVRGLPNYFKRNVQACEGRVEIHWLPFTFTMNWKIIDPNVPVTFVKGEPICFIEPQQLHLIERIIPSIDSINNYPELKSDYEEWSKSRARFNARPDRSEKDWQRGYHNGMPREDGSTIEPPANHRTSIKPKPFMRRKNDSSTS